jgi:glycosyltransferase involved in cell wall biosynthesis
VYRAVLEEGRAWHPDLIYERYALTAIAGSLAARRLGIPHLVEVNAPLALEEARFRGLRLGAVARWAERWILRRADVVVVVSHALAAHVRRLGVRPERIHVVPNGVDRRLFHAGLGAGAVRTRLGLEGRFVVGFSGTLKPWHGLHHLLHALEQAKKTPMHLLVIGDGPERERLLLLTRALGLEDRVHFVGSVPHDQVGRYLAACDVLVAPYGRIEHDWFSPLKVAEYLACGRPVVASAIGQLAEEAGPAAGVLLVPPGDEQALARVLTELALDAERCQRLAHAAASHPPWTWEQVVARILAAGETARRMRWGWSP